MDFTATLQGAMGSWSCTQDCPFALLRVVMGYSPAAPPGRFLVAFLAGVTCRIRVKILRMEGLILL
jgi:hypothetical protein